MTSNDAELFYIRLVLHTEIWILSGDEAKNLILEEVRDYSYNFCTYLDYNSPFLIL